MQSDPIRTQKVVVSLASVLKLAKDYETLKRRREELNTPAGRNTSTYDVTNARFLAYNNIIVDLNLPVEL